MRSLTALQTFVLGMRYLHSASKFEQNKSKWIELVFVAAVMLYTMAIISMTLVLSLTFPGYTSTMKQIFEWTLQYYNPIVTAALYLFMAFTSASAIIIVVGTYRITKII